MPNIIKKCKKHGETEFILEGRGYHRCKKCRVESVTKNRIKRKTKLINEFGNRCSKCGYNKCQEALHFHHLIPQEKEFGISESGLCRSWEKAIKEASKCILVCANCHAEIEAGITKI